MYQPLTRRIGVLAGLAGLLVAAGCDSAGPALSANGPATASASASVVVTEDDVTRQAENTPPTNNWVLYTRTPASTGVFLAGPGTPPAGVGSFEMGTPTGADKVYLFNYDHTGTRLADIESVGYQTYRSAGVGVAVASINIQVDVNGDAPGGFATLVYEPYHTFPNPIVNDTWQAWDAVSGGSAKWWGTSAAAGACPQSAPCTWSALLGHFPDAVIGGAFGVNQGSGNPAIVSAVDQLSIGYGGNTVTYNFEPYRVPTNRDECKDGGWQTLRRADGTPFRNQGACVSYVNTGR